MQIRKNLQDVDERITILRYELIHNEYELSEVFLEITDELERIRLELHDYLENLRITRPHEWQSLRSEVDNKFSAFEEIREGLTIPKILNTNHLRREKV